MLNIAVFASGSGSNAENIINYFKDNNTILIKLIVSNNPNAYVHQRAQKAGIESITFPKADFDNPVRILDCLKKYHIDFIVLAGFLLKIPQSIINAYPDRIINIHPALLPKYGGKGMYGDKVHKAVVSAGEQETGITIHYVNENYDEGNIIFQAKCTIDSEDTFETVAEKVHQLEYKYFPEVIDKLTTNLI